MFGLRSDLDNETLALLDEQVDLVGKSRLTASDKKRLRELSVALDKLGFKSASSDPYYRAFLAAVTRRRRAKKLLQQPELTRTDRTALAKETDEILEQLESEERGA
jgi:hypothetical protein